MGTMFLNGDMEPPPFGSSQTPSTSEGDPLFDKCFAIEEGFTFRLNVSVRSGMGTVTGSNPPKETPFLKFYFINTCFAYSDKMCLPESIVTVDGTKNCTMQTAAKGPIPEGPYTTHHITFEYSCKWGPCLCGECLSSPPPYGVDICIPQYAVKSERGEQMVASGDGRPFSPILGDDPNIPCAHSSAGPAGGKEWSKNLWDGPGTRSTGKISFDSALAKAAEKAIKEALDEIDFCCKSNKPSSRQVLKDFITEWEAMPQSGC